MHEHCLAASLDIRNGGSGQTGSIGESGLRHSDHLTTGSDSRAYSEVDLVAHNPRIFHQELNKPFRSDVNVVDIVGEGLA